MPSLTREAYPHNALITEKFCKECGIKFYAHNKVAEYCSNLCRLHASHKRRALPPEPIPEPIPKINVKKASLSTRFRGKREVQIACMERGVKFTLKSLSDMPIGSTLFNSSANIRIKRTNTQVWELV